ncbi:MAG: DUF362 domain-containing protein [Candidatus Izimaplasma sp.]|nr:DUF362 domain-containing protein [Candidatus Izimaplasma bacterium]
MSTVVVLKIQEYALPEIKNQLSKGLALLGGIESIIPKNKSILLKPNMLMGTDSASAVTTHPIIFQAIAEILQDNNYTVGYGDSPGFGSPDKVASKTGIKQIADTLEIPLADFTHGHTIHFPEGVISKQFEIVDAFKAYDAIINLPKMKTHALQRITGAVKNSFGLVHGLNKGLMHGRFQNAKTFAQMLVDLNQYLKVDLHILDGVVAMEGNGPKNGTPTDMHTLMISTDPVALDTVFCQLINLDPTIIPTITLGNTSGLGNYQSIELLGDDIKSLINPHFKVDRSPLKETESSSLSFLKNHIIRRPYIITNDCKKCGVCVDVCPVEDKAIQFQTEYKVAPPIYNYKACIRCYCCQEMCPHDAIDVKTPILGKLAYALNILK